MMITKTRKLQHMEKACIAGISVLDFSWFRAFVIQILSPPDAQKTSRLPTSGL